MFDQNTFAGTGILLEDPIIDRTTRGSDRIQLKVKHTYGQNETFYLCVAYDADAHKIHQRQCEAGMFISFSGSIKLVANQGTPYIQVNLDRLSALAHYTGPNDGVHAPQGETTYAEQPQPGPFDTVAGSPANNAGNQTVQQSGQTQQRRPHNNPPQNNSTSQPRNTGKGFAGVPGSNGKGYIDKGPFQPTNLKADPRHRTTVSADPWGNLGKAAANGF